MPNSPVANAGRKKGDVILKIAKKDRGSLRNASNILEKLKPRQKISICCLGEKKHFENDFILKSKYK